MTSLIRIYCAQRQLYNSSHKCLWSSPMSNEDITNGTSGNTLSQLNNGNPIKTSENEMISIEKEDTLLDDNSIVNENEEPILPEEPTTCCMSGCANCVWVEYAEQLCKVLKDGHKAREMVLTKVTDPNMKAFLLMELKSLKK